MLYFCFSTLLLHNCTCWLHTCATLCYTHWPHFLLDFFLHSFATLFVQTFARLLVYTFSYTHFLHFWYTFGTHFLHFPTLICYTFGTLLYAFPLLHSSATLLLPFVCHTFVTLIGYTFPTLLLRFLLHFLLDFSYIHWLATQK